MVVMGRKTLASFPGGRPLKNRVNVVVSTTRPAEDTRIDENTRLICVGSYEDLFRVLTAWPKEDIFLIGGGMLYRDLLSECRTAYVTYMKNIFPEADTWYPNLDEDPEWELRESSEWKTFEEITFSFRTYQRRA